MSSILIVYASSHGQTRTIATRLAERLDQDGYGVTLVDANEPTIPPPHDFDAVVLGSRVHFGRHAREIVDYIKHNREGLGDRPTFFFSVSMAAVGAVSSQGPNDPLQHLYDETGWTPQHGVVFAGGLPYRKYGWFMRQVMKQVSRKAGHETDTSKNHDFTDWKKVEQLADDIARQLVAGDTPIPAASWL